MAAKVPLRYDMTSGVRRIPRAWEGIRERPRLTPGEIPAVSLQPATWPILLRAVAVPATGEVDELVLVRARHGDQDAFADIVGRYDHRLRALAFRLLGDRDRMDDVLQEAYVKAFRALPRFKGTSTLGTWLYRITYNACLDELRRRPSVAPMTYENAGAASIADPGPGPADIVIERDDLAAALDRLPTDQRAAVMLVDAYGLDYAEAADVLGVRAGTIGSRLSRAHAVLRTALESGQVDQ